MTPWMDGYLNANGIKIHYHRTGGGKPPLLLLHGITDNGLCWTRVAEDLQDCCDVIMTDARGHGLSDRIESGFSIPILAADAAGVIQALGLGPTVVWGHSMGAITAAHLAADYPHLVAAVILEDPPLEERDKSIPPEIIAGIKQNMLDLKALSPQDRLARAAVQNPGWHPAELPSWAASKAEVDLEVFSRFAAFHERPWQEVFTRLQCPGLLITGDLTRGAIVKPETARQSLELWPRGQVLDFAAGHNIHRECYTEVMAAVGSFLKSVDTAGENQVK